MDKWATVLRYGITYVFAPIAAKYGLDATTQGNFVDAIYALIAAIITLSPMVYNLVTRPSTAAMQVAVEADKVIAGEKKDAVVQTPGTQPDISIRGR